MTYAKLFRELLEEHGNDWFVAEVTNTGTEERPRWELLVYPSEMQPGFVGTWFTGMFVNGEKVDPLDIHLDEMNLKVVREYGDNFSRSASEIELYFVEETVETIHWIRMEPTLQEDEHEQISETIDV